MKLQLALDDLSLEDALSLTESVANSIDIIEIGTPMVYEYGMNAVRIFRSKFPHHEILADLKIMDAGTLEAGEAFQAGADMTTVLGVSDLATIEDCIQCANENQSVYVDLICCKNLPERIEQLRKVGVKCLSVHVGVDQQAKGQTPLEVLKTVKALAPDLKISVAGGINEKTVAQYIELQPEVVICGGGIVHAKDPTAAARAIARIVHQT
ncbi:3-hexulose-6-phosphate synthase [Erysipelotrichaceae bacterium 51-3]